MAAAEGFELGKRGGQQALLHLYFAAAANDRRGPAGPGLPAHAWLGRGEELPNRCAPLPGGRRARHGAGSRPLQLPKGEGHRGRASPLAPRRSAGETLAVGLCNMRCWCRLRGVLLSMSSRRGAAPSREQGDAALPNGLLTWATWTPNALSAAC